MSASKPNKSLMRSLGEFVGHIVRGVKTPADAPAAPSQVLKHEVEETTGETPGGQRVTLRRTTVEEIRVEPMEGRDAP